MHKFNKSILREYDIRGIVGDTVDETDAYYIGKGLAKICGNNGTKKAIIGYDGRLSSPMLFENLKNGFIESGFDVISVGLCPTPLLYMAANEFENDIAVMITGSHNAPKYNGFKIMKNKKSFFGQDILNLGDVVENGNFIEGFGEFKEIDFKQQYVKRILKDFPLDTNLKCVWDPGNGAMGAVLGDVVAKIGTKDSQKIIHGDVDGNFPNHHPDPTVEENLNDIKNEIKQNGYDIGIAFDGDGDRVGIVSENGNVVWGDQMLCLLGRDILKKYPGCNILFDVKCSDVLVNEIKKYGGVPVMVPTGHSIVKSKMVEYNAPLAGEMSAHIFFSDDFYGYDDALYVALRFIRVLIDENISCDEFLQSLPKYYNTPEIRIDVKEEIKFKIIEDINKVAKTYENWELNNIDGVRATYDTGWWLIRASNTQNAITLRCEAISKSELVKTLNNIKQILSKFDIEFDIDEYIK